MSSQHNPVVLQLAQFLIQHQLTLCTAESCTGGMVSSALTEISGSSNWFERGYVTYSNESKRHDLGVPMDLIQVSGAVSIPVAKEMALGALRSSGSSVSLSITGVAGPTGGSIEKPVGYVCFGWAWKIHGELIVEAEGVNLLNNKSKINDDTRMAVRTLALQYSLEQLLKKLQAAF
ncbi:MAG: CinA family protein [Betaproteobacteria bacterium]|jgi:nicotinamide-nucleotide amidase